MLCLNESLCHVFIKKNTKVHDPGTISNGNEGYDCNCTIIWLPFQITVIDLMRAQWVKVNICINSNQTVAWCILDQSFLSFNDTSFVVSKILTLSLTFFFFVLIFLTCFPILFATLINSQCIYISFSRWKHVVSSSTSFVHCTV